MANTTLDKSSVVLDLVDSASSDLQFIVLLVLCFAEFGGSTWMSNLHQNDMKIH